MYGIICSKGRVVCKGSSKTKQSLFSEEGLAVATRSGTSVFTFDTTHFECGVSVIKNFKDEITYALDDDTIVTENFITSNMICNIVSD